MYISLAGPRFLALLVFYQNNKIMVNNNKTRSRGKEEEQAVEECIVYRLFSAYWLL